MGLKDFSYRSPRALVIGFPPGVRGMGGTGTRSVVTRSLSILSWDKATSTLLFWLSLLPNPLRRLKTKPPPRHDKLLTMQVDGLFCSWALCFKPWAEVSLVNLILIKISLLFRYKSCSYNLYISSVLRCLWKQGSNITVSLPSIQWLGCSARNCKYLQLRISPDTPCFALPPPPFCLP